GSPPSPEVQGWAWPSPSASSAPTAGASTPCASRAAPASSSPSRAPTSPSANTSPRCPPAATTCRFTHAGTNMKILIVDDQRSARRVLRTMLATLEGVEVSEAGSVDEARQLVQRTPPDLLLLDIRLSPDARDRGGLDLLRRLRANGSAVPAVMVTSLVELSEIREAMRNGAQD